MADGGGLSVFVVEDEVLILEMICKQVTAAGHVVRAKATNLGDALSLVDELASEFDAAMLDVNLAGELSKPLADRLLALGIPFIYITGYSAADLSDLGANARILQKPYRRQELVDALNGLRRP